MFGLKKKNDTGVPLQECFEKLEQNEVRMSETANALVNHISALSGFDVGMEQIADHLAEFAKELAELSESNLSILEEASASMNQVNQLIEESSDSLQNLSEEADILAKKNLESKELLKEVGQIKQEVADGSAEMTKEIESLLKLTEEVGKIVTSVQGIASQTNLLALNASIEAARAGEQGKGFAVVADEVRQLADDTRQSLEGMTEVVKNIGNAANAGKNSMTKSMNATAKMNSRMDVVTENIGENIQGFESVTESVKNVNQTLASIREAASEINIAVEGAVTDADQLTDMTRALKDQAENTAQFSKNLMSIDDDLTNLSIEMFADVQKTNRSVTNEELLAIVEKAKNAHQTWLATMHGIIDEMKVRPLQTNGNKCAFGHFYQVIRVKNPALQSEWSKIKNLHSQFHSYGTNVLTCVKRQDEKGAREAADQADQLSVSLLGLLEEVSQMIRKLEQEGEKAC